MDETKTEGAQQPARKRLTPIDVQQKVFRRAAFRGYHEQDVDDFLDEITEELALLLDEVRQLRERAGIDPFTGSSSVRVDTADALRTADDIVRQAREEAAEILRRARAEAATSAGGGTGGAALQPFLAQERAFLQDLSRLIQGHADTVRDMARSRRTAAQAPPAPAAPAEAMDDQTVEVGEAEPSAPAEDRV